MAQISRSTKIGGGTTLSSNTLARAADVETDMLTLLNAHNNHDTAASAWTAVSASGSTTVPLSVDNSSGTQNIANFKDNGTTVLSVADGGTVTIAPAGTTKVVANSSGLTLSNSATIAMGTAKITGLAAATTTGDAVRFEQLILKAAPVIATDTTATSTTTNIAGGGASTNTVASITPTSSSSRVRITVHGNLTPAVNGATATVTLYRNGSTNLGGATWFTKTVVGGATICAPTSMVYIDSPASTSSTTYAVRVASQDGASTVYWNKDSLTSVIILEEIV